MIAKANSVAKECDELRDKNSLLFPPSEIGSAEKIDIERAVETTLAETARWRHPIGSMPPVDLARVLFDFAAEQSKPGSRHPATIPSDIGFAVVRQDCCRRNRGRLLRSAGDARSFVCWIIPRLRKLYAFLKGEIEARLAETR